MDKRSMTKSLAMKSSLLGKRCTLKHFWMKMNSRGNVCRQSLQLQSMYQRDRLHMFAGMPLQW